MRNRQSKRQHVFIIHVYASLNLYSRGPLPAAKVDLKPLAEVPCSKGVGLSGRFEIIRYNFAGPKLQTIHPTTIPAALGDSYYTIAGQGAMWHSSTRSPRYHY